MARTGGPSDEDYDSAARFGLLGLTAGEDADLDSIMEQLAVLHPRNNTFPAEVLLELAAEAIEESSASPADPIQYEGMRDRLLPQYHFRGKSQQHKSHYALMDAAPSPGGGASTWGTPNRRPRRPPRHRRRGDRSSPVDDRRWWSSSDRRAVRRSGRHAEALPHRAPP
jgi:hypothetical protein